MGRQSKHKQQRRDLQEIKPIETIYKDYHFRSRLEARWAVFFDSLSIPYDYEKEGYDLGEYGRYLPDFWMPTWDSWIEIKPREPGAEDINAHFKCNQLWNKTGKRVFMICGNPYPQEYIVMCYHNTPDSGLGKWQGISSFSYTDENNKKIYDRRIGISEDGKYKFQWIAYPIETLQEWIIDPKEVKTVNEEDAPGFGNNKFHIINPFEKNSIVIVTSLLYPAFLVLTTVWNFSECRNCEDLWLSTYPDHMNHFALGNCCDRWDRNIPLVESNRLNAAYSSARKARFESKGK